MADDDIEQPKRPSFRLTAEQKAEIAETVAQRLAKDPRFQRNVVFRMVGMAAVILILFGWGTGTYLNSRLKTYIGESDADVSNRLFIARQEVTNRITKEFETERIKAVVTAVASNRASELLASQIQPEIAQFRQAISNELAETESHLRAATQRVAAVETRTRPKPFKERLKAFLDSKDKAILTGLANGVTRFEWEVSEYDLGKLGEFCAEPEGPEYIQSFPREVSITADGASTRKVDLRLNPNLLK